MKPARTNQGAGKGSKKSLALCGGGAARSRTKGLSCKSSFVDTSLFFADIFSHSLYCFTACNCQNKPTMSFDHLYIEAEKICVSHESLKDGYISGSFLAARFKHIDF